MMREVGCGPADAASTDSVFDGETGNELLVVPPLLQPASRPMAAQRPRAYLSELDINISLSPPSFMDCIGA
ncbi:MAG: hypothetical protein WB810_15170, partial [Candidatus Cybelea sp.]